MGRSDPHARRTACPRVTRSSHRTRGRSLHRHPHAGTTARAGSRVKTMTTRTRTPFPLSSSQQRTAAPGGEASGLIDIRTLGAMIGGETSATAPSRAAPASEPPHFAGLSLSPPVQPTLVRPPTGPSPVVPRSQGPIYALLGALAVGVLGLAAVVVTSPQPEAGTVTYILRPDVVAVADRREPAEDPAAEVAAEPVAEPEAVVPEKTPGKVPGKPRKPASKPEAKPAVDAKPEVKQPKVEPKQEYGVDCLLGKTSCGERAQPVIEAEPVRLPSDLPEKLEQADISAGTSAARAAATSACAKLAKGGEKVQVKLSIAGPTGSVIATTPTEDAGNPALAACVAKQLEAASFRKVQKQQIGTVVTVKF